MERTHRLGSWQGAASAEYDYDDATGQILRVRGVNTGPGVLRVRIFGTDTSGEASGWQREYTFAPGTTEEHVIPPGQRKRFALEPDGGPPGRPDEYPTLRGLAWEVSY